jgi:nucleotide-binding universal stress UspA family protein
MSDVPETTLTPPFGCVLVPYDGSEPSKAALNLAIALLPSPSRLVVMTVVDESQVLAQATTTTMAYDPTPLFDAVEGQGQATLAEATQMCTAAKLAPVSELVHDTPVSGILSMIETHGVDLVVMGTHARTGAARLFLGSTTDGVLRATSTPVLTVRSGDAISGAPFATALLGVDDSDASDAAAALAARLVRAFGTHVIACNAVDTTPMYESMAAYPFDPQELLKEMRTEAAAVVTKSLKRASLENDAVTVKIVEGNAASVLVETAEDAKASIVVLGSHGRRGLRRFFLGSVAEEVVRRSSIPVLVAREAV